MEPSTPIYSDRPRIALRYIIYPILLGVLVIMGILNSDPFVVVGGVGLALYLWFTRHMRYDIFAESLLIQYGKPRRRMVPLGEITKVYIVKPPFGGGRVILRQQHQGPMILRPSNPEEFLERLDEVRRRLGHEPEPAA